MAGKSAVATRFQLRRGLAEPEAALYLGVGATKFRQLVNEGRMPRPRLIDARRVWDVDDVDDLDAAFRNLPIEKENDGGDDPWSRVSV